MENHERSNKYENRSKNNKNTTSLMQQQHPSAVIHSKNVEHLSISDNDVQDGVQLVQDEQIPPRQRPTTNNHTPTTTVRRDPNSLPRPYQVQTPARYRRPMMTTTTTTPNNSNGTTTSNHRNVEPSASASSRSSRQVQVSEEIQNRVTTTSTSNPLNRTTSLRLHQSISTPVKNEKQVQRRDSMKDNVSQNNNNDSLPHGNSSARQQRMTQQQTSGNVFQNNIHDTPSFRIQYVNIIQRSIFGLNPIISFTEWTRIVQELETIYPKKGMMNRISPSYEHLQLLHQMQSSMLMIRQIHFSSSTSIDSEFFSTIPSGSIEDCYYDDDVVNDCSDTTTINNNTDPIIGQHRNFDRIPTNSSVKNERTSRRRRRNDGRYTYHPIDPVLALRNTIPETVQAPILSHKKSRIPFRADVGFPNASNDEIQQKQKEIQWESMWEESSPRIILAVTSDDVGSAVIDDEVSHASKIPTIQRQQPYGDYRIEGIPYAGRDLLLAYQRNRRLHRKYKKNEQQVSKDEKNISGGFDTQKIPHFLQPDPYSMLAPPLGSSYSKSQGWKPRTYHDRLPTMVYFVSYLSSVQFVNERRLSSNYDNDNNLIGSLSLYRLPANGQLPLGTMSSRKYGKVSESFWFPIDESKYEALYGESSQKRSSRESKPQIPKAIFSINCLDMGTSNETDAPTAPFFITLEIFKVNKSIIRSGDVESDKITWKKQSELNINFSASDTSSCDLNPSQFVESVHNYKFQLAQQGHFLSPVCFGVSEALLRSDAGFELEKLYLGTSTTRNQTISQWPGEESMRIRLFASTRDPMSHDQFVERLCDIIQGRSMDSSDHEIPNQNVEVHVSQSSVTTRDETLDLSIQSSPSVKKNRKLGGRFLRVPYKLSKVKTSTQLDNADLIPTQRDKTDLNPTPLSLDVGSLGYAVLNSSYLGNDILYALLAAKEEQPKTIDIDQSHESASSPSTSLLVDISGDFAVALDRRQDDNFSYITKETAYAANQIKRSNLRRLGKGMEKAGYTNAAEFREILYMPLHFGKQYDFDVHPSFHSLLNVLYVYPLRLRTLDNGPRKSSNDKRKGIMIRTRIVKKDITKDAVSGEITMTLKAINCCYSRTPWTGNGLMDSCFTLICGDASSKSLQPDLPLWDEVKIALPEILDGSYTLEFSLFDVAVSNDNIASLTFVAKSKIPLSNSVSESSSGTRIATVIPNGKHRLELGNFQFHFETRLVSSIHVADPSMATILKEIKLPTFKESSSISVPIAHANIKSVMRLMVSTSESSVVGQFPILMIYALSNLLRPPSVQDSTDEPHSASVYVRFLLEVLEKLKMTLHAQPSSLHQAFHFGAFVKSYLDTFDERLLRCPSQVSTESATLSLINSNANFDPNRDDEGEVDTLRFTFDEQNEPSISNSSRIRRNKVMRDASSRRRISKNVPPTPFTRTPFGATKLDFMRVEVELQDGEHFSSYFDDDETVATASSMATISTRGHSVIHSTRNQTIRPTLTALQESTLEEQDNIRGNHNSSKQPDDSFRNMDGAEFAKRMKQVAHDMLAPCVGPSLANILATEGPESPPVKDAKFYNGIDNDTGDSMNLETNQCVCLPGTNHQDIQEPVVKPSVLEVPSTNQFNFHVPYNIPVLTFGLFDAGNNATQTSTGQFIYESIISLWVQSYIDYCQPAPSVSNHGFTLTHEFHRIPVFVEDVEISTSSKRKHLFLQFFAQIDTLLPLCLKSFLLRCSESFSGNSSNIRKVQLDSNHLEVMKLFLEILAKGVLGLSQTGEAQDGSSTTSLDRAIVTSNCISDFIVGLFVVLPIEQLKILIRSYIGAFKHPTVFNVRKDVSDFKWTEENIRLTTASFQLRLSFLERIAVTPSFLSLNFPATYVEMHKSPDEVMCGLGQIFDSTSLSPPIDENNTSSKSGWLAELVLSETLLVCACSCQTMVSEATAQVADPNHSTRPLTGFTMTRNNLLGFHSVGLHAISVVYELVLRRHSMDSRFQSSWCQSHIAGLFASPILESSVVDVRWLSRMEATQKIRSLWVLCLIYILQEAPEIVVQDFLHACVMSKDSKILKFLRVLRICCSTFQIFIDTPNHPELFSQVLAPSWILQEGFNTVCASVNLVVDLMVKHSCQISVEKKKIIHSILNLLLQILATPQSSVAQLRGVGGALHCLEQFGLAEFLDVAGPNFQHWARVLLSLMNSTSLSVRSISVDFVVCIFSSAFRMYGTIDSILNIFLSVLPEVVAREIALYCVNGCVTQFNDIFRVLWPLRRSIADLEECDPLDDDRVDPQLVPLISIFCRSLQAIIDGVLIEIKLKGNPLNIAGIPIDNEYSADSAFDADEESLLEAATSFSPETSQSQRLRWLLTLNLLHKTKEQWEEAAETSFLCAQTLIESIPHITDEWRPTRFSPWWDNKRLMWLNGHNSLHTGSGNVDVMGFAETFLGSSTLMGVEWASVASGKPPSLADVCTLLQLIIKESAKMYLLNESMNEFAYNRFEALLSMFISLSEIFSPRKRQAPSRGQIVDAGMDSVHGKALFRKTIALISSQMATFSERLGDNLFTRPRIVEKICFFVVMKVSGKKPLRFLESTALPTFLEWEKPCICRVPNSLAFNADGSNKESNARTCTDFVKPLYAALIEECGVGNVTVVTDPYSGADVNHMVTIIEVFPVETVVHPDMTGSSFPFKHVTHHTMDAMVENTVACEFPYVLSRQTSIMTSKIIRTSNFANKNLTNGIIFK